MSVFRRTVLAVAGMLAATSVAVVPGRPAVAALPTAAVAMIIQSL